MSFRLSAKILLAMAVFSAPVVQAQDAAFDPAQALEDVRILLDETTARLPTIDAVLNQTAFDAEALVSYVRDDITYHFYAGVQRGVSGTLLGRSGNSWDQAITLAGLLTEAGYEAFVAYGTVEGVVFPAPRAAQLSGDGSANQDFTDLVAARLSQIETTLQEAQIALGSEGVLAETTYAWVKWRDTPADDYTDVHPVFAEDLLPEAVTQTGSVTGTVPPGQVMSLSIRPFAAVQSGETVTRRWVADPVNGAVANMWGVRQIFAFVPTTAGVIIADLPEGADEAEVAYARLVTSPSFIATLNGQPMAGAQHVSRRGDLLSPQDAASAMAGVFETVAANTGNAANAMAALGQAAAEGEASSVVPQLVGAGFELTLTGPDMPPVVFTRHMLTPDTAAADADRWFADLTQSFDLVVQPGPEPVDAIANRTGQDYQRLISVYQELAGESVDLTTAWEAYDFDALRSSAAMTAAVPVTSFGRSAAPATAQSGPMIAALITRILPDPAFALTEQRQIFDIMQRPVIGAAPEVLARSVTESLAERFALEGNLGMGAATLLSRDAGLQVVTDAAMLGALGIADIALDPIRGDLAAGHVVLVSSASDPVLAWWRIDPTTGLALGRSHAGWGNELTEFISNVQISFSLWTGLLQAGKCGADAASAGQGFSSASGCIFCVAVGAVGDVSKLGSVAESGQKILANSCSYR